MSVTRRKRISSRSISDVCKGPIMAHVGFEGARHMHPERMPSAKGERTVSLRLFDVTKDTIADIEQHSNTIKRLMIHGLHLNNVSESLVDRMSLLEKLDLGENQLGDGSLPDSFKKLENLVELNLNNNKFTKIPSSVRKLRNLTRLNLSHNGIDSLKGLDKLKKMQVLILDHNKFAHVFKDISHMKRLEILDCSYNNVREVGLDIRFLKNLKELNITNNRISVLPTDVFQLLKLESLKAGQNQISKIPVFNMNPQHCHTLAEIDLAGNAINKFPGHLLQLTRKLDLSNNRIKTLDWNKMKKIEMKSGQEMFVDGNPITFPPEDVCECGLQSMMQFFQETHANVKVHQGIKVLVLGAHNSGKTSFVQTLVDGMGRLSEEMYEKSAGIEPSEVAYDIANQEALQSHRKASLAKQDTSNKLISNENPESQTTQPTTLSLNLTLWDFCGHSFYLFPHYMFFEQPAIAVLTFNMQTYKSDTFDEVIGAWFDWMIAKTNKLVVLMVGTHADKLKSDQIKKVCNEVKKKLSAHAEKQRQVVQKKIDRITEKSHISQTLSSQLNAYSSLLQEKFVVQSEVIVTSAANNTGYDTVRSSIEKLVHDQKQFPNVLRVIPTFWMDVETYTEERGNSMVVPVIKFEDFREEVGEKFGMKHLVTTIVQYLHETGKVLWFSNNAALKGFVILRPAWFFDIFRAIFRHDLKEKLSVEVEDIFRTIDDEDEDSGITQSRYDQMKDEFLTEGIVDRDLLKCMFSSLLPLETNGPFYQVIDMLMNTLDMGYVVTKRPREADYNLDQDQDNGLNKKYLIPWFRKVPQPERVQELWAPLTDKRKLVAVCRFPRYMPPGLFEMLSVRAHREKHNLKFLYHWGLGFHSRHRKEAIQVMITCHAHEEDNGATVRFELRDDSASSVEEVPASNMWSVLLPILMEMEELLHSYTGVLVERQMECPQCHELSFLGEWLTPKETQGMETRECDACQEEIDTNFLVQPREKKRDDVRLNLALMRKQRRDALQSASGSVSIKAPVRQGRRAAVMPMDMLLMNDTGSSNEDTDADAMPGRPLLPGLLPGMDLPPFLTGLLENSGSTIPDDNESESAEPMRPHNLTESTDGC